jgi:CheY-like chemotaxis protein
MTDEKQKRVLVIDDNDEARTLVSVVLTKAGYRVTGAGDSASAVEELESDGYGVILLDFKMPHDGVALIDYMSANLPHVLTRTVVFIPSVNRPIWAVLPKPFDVEDLVTTVTACAAQSN